MKTAFSTVACPRWTLEQAARAGAAAGFAGIELRSFGPADATLACDPALTGPARARDIFEDAGVDPVAIATSIRYDQPIWPPVLGRVLNDVEKPVRETREAVHLAASIECPYVRVFGFELQPGEKRRAGLRRILERLDLAVRTARHTGVKILLENGGSFPAARDVIEIIDAIGSPLVHAAYAPAAAAGREDPVEGALLLADRLAVLKLKDFRDGRPVVIGDGELSPEPVVRALSNAGFQGWAVVEHDRLWFADLPEPGPVLAESVARLDRWIDRPMTDIERRKFARA